MKLDINILLNIIKEFVDEGMEVTTIPVSKGNITLTGILIKKPTDTIVPTMYLEHYEQYENEGYVYIARKIIEDFKNVKSPAFDIKNISTWGYAKENMMLCISPKLNDTNIVTISYLDLDVYFRVLIPSEDDSDGIGSYKVTSAMLTIWNKTKYDLLAATRNNEYEIKSMQEIISEIMGADVDDMDIPDNMSKQFVIKSKTDFGYGASVIYVTEVLKRIADECDTDLYILPSSIHEIIVMPFDSFVPLNELSTMVREVNETTVDPTEVLSDHAYIFKRETMEVTW